MEVEISNEMSSDIQSISRILGFNENELIRKAVSFYLDSMKRQFDLKQELEEFDFLSDEALINFENELPKR